MHLGIQLFSFRELRSDRYIHSIQVMHVRLVRFFEKIAEVYVLLSLTSYSVSVPEEQDRILLSRQ
jgi:hypothetical protein